MLQLTLPEAASKAIEALLDIISPVQPTYPRACPVTGYDHPVRNGELDSCCPGCCDPHRMDCGCGARGCFHTPCVSDIV
jgi:hypothetical protein